MTHSDIRTLPIDIIGFGVTQGIPAQPAHKASMRTSIVAALLNAIARQVGSPIYLLGDHKAVLAGAPSDIDIALPLPDRRKRGLVIRQALNELPWPTRLVQVIQHEAHAHYFVVAVDTGGTWELFHPDLTTDYVRVGRPLIKFSTFAIGAQPLESLSGVWIPSAATAFNYYAVKRVSKGHVTMSGMAYLDELLQADVAAVSLRSEEVFGKHCSSMLLECIVGRDAKRFASIASMARPTLYAKHAPHFGHRIAESGRMLRRLVEPTGLAIAVYGPDGSGKSTTIASVRSVVDGAFRATEEWHLLEPIRPDKRGSPQTNPHGQSPRGPVTSLLKVLWYLLVAWVVRAPSIFLGRRRSRLILLDRDLLDLAVDPVRYRLGFGGPPLRWILRLRPRPDFNLLLEAPSSVIVARSNELDSFTIEQLRGRYQELVARGSTAYVIDASKAAALVEHEAASVILDWLEKRTAKRIARGSGPVIGRARR